MHNLSDMSVPPGTQTLVRGLSILEHVAHSSTGLTVQQVAERAGVHRTMALRSLSALANFNLVRKGADGRYRVAAGVVALGREYLPALREISGPILEDLTAQLGASMCLFVADGDSAVAVTVMEPDDSSFHLTFRTGSRHPLHRGSAGYALASLRPASPDDPAPVVAARRDGYARSYGEVEPGAWGVSVPLDPDSVGVDACVHLTTFREEVADRATDLVLRAAHKIERLCAPSTG